MPGTFRFVFCIAADVASAAIFVFTTKNKAQLPIFGCFVSGRNWFFVLLEGDKYSLSDAYVATSEDIFKIFAIMKKCKQMIEAYAQSN